MTSAIASLADGDTITIAGSFSGANYDISGKTNITVNSTSSSNTITLSNNAGADAYVLNASGIGARVSGFTIDGNKGNQSTASGACVYTGYSGKIDHMTLQNCYKWGVIVALDSSGWEISDNTITGIGGTTLNLNIEGRGVSVNQGTNGSILRNAISSTRGDGVYLINAATGNTIRNNTLTSIGMTGIYVGAATGTGNTISGNTITDWASEGASDGIGLNATATITGNTITQNTDTAYAAWGIEITGGAAACDGTTISSNTIGGATLDRALAGGGSNVTITRNSLQANTHVIYQENCSGSNITYNVIKANGAAGDYGIYLDSNAAGARAINLYNNTVVNMNATGTGVRFEETNGTWGSCNLKNNIVNGFSKGVIIEDKDNDGAGVTHTNNLYYGNTADLQKDVAGVLTGITLDGTELSSNPIFVSSSNYHLQATSPARDAGANVGLTLDYDGHSVPVGSGVDIGAYEYVPGGDTTPPSAPMGLRVQ